MKNESVKKSLEKSKKKNAETVKQKMCIKNNNTFTKSASNFLREQLKIQYCFLKTLSVKVKRSMNQKYTSRTANVNRFYTNPTRKTKKSRKTKSELIFSKESFDTETWLVLTQTTTSHIIN